MALAETRCGDTHEPRGLHLLDRGGPAVAHRLSQPADELVDDPRHRPLVRDAALDALGHELVDVLNVALEVAVARRSARTHRTERAHAAVLLEPLALMQHDVTWALVRAREQRAGHDRVGTRRDRFRDVSR